MEVRCSRLVRELLSPDSMPARTALVISIASTPCAAGVVPPSRTESAARSSPATAGAERSCGSPPAPTWRAGRPRAIATSTSASAWCTSGWPRRRAGSEDARARQHGAMGAEAAEVIEARGSYVDAARCCARAAGTGPGSAPAASSCARHGRADARSAPRRPHRVGDLRAGQGGGRRLEQRHVRRRLRLRRLRHGPVHRVGGALRGG
jgi:hypothetical protein